LTRVNERCYRLIVIKVVLFVLVLGVLACKGEKTVEGSPSEPQSVVLQNPSEEERRRDRYIIETALRESARTLRDIPVAELLEEVPSNADYIGDDPDFMKRYWREDDSSLR